MNYKLHLKHMKYYAASITLCNFQMQDAMRAAAQ